MSALGHNPTSALVAGMSASGAKAVVRGHPILLACQHESMVQTEQCLFKSRRPLLVIPRRQVWTRSCPFSGVNPTSIWRDGMSAMGVSKQPGLRLLTDGRSLDR